MNHGHGPGLLRHSRNTFCNTKISFKIKNTISSLISTPRFSKYRGAALNIGKIDSYLVSHVKISLWSSKPHMLRKLFTFWYFFNIFKLIDFFKLLIIGKIIF